MAGRGAGFKLAAAPWVSSSADAGEICHYLDIIGKERLQLNIRPIFVVAALALTACGGVDSQTPSRAIAQRELTTVISAGKVQPKETRLIRESTVEGRWIYEYQATYESEVKKYTVFVHKDGRVEIAPGND